MIGGEGLATCAFTQAKLRLVSRFLGKRVVHLRSRRPLAFIVLVPSVLLSLVYSGSESSLKQIISLSQDLSLPILVAESVQKILSGLNVC